MRTAEVPCSKTSRTPYDTSTPKKCGKMKLDPCAFIFVTSLIAFNKARGRLKIPFVGLSFWCLVEIIGSNRFTQNSLNRLILTVGFLLAYAVLYHWILPKVHWKIREELRNLKYCQPEGQDTKVMVKNFLSKTKSRSKNQTKPNRKTEETA